MRQLNRLNTTFRAIGFTATAITFLGAILFLGSCSDDDTAPPEPPNISLNQGSEAITQQPGKVVNVELGLQASEGLKSLDVNLDEADFDEVTYGDELTAIYTLDFEVPITAAVDDEFVFDFVLADDLDVTNSLRITISTVENTFFVTEETLGTTTVLAISGTINDQFTLKATESYLLDSVVQVGDGGEIVIPAGTTIYGRSFKNAGGENPGNNNSRLDILPGGTITAEGTKDEPIVFTSSFVLDPAREPEAGDWGGIGIYGKAFVNENADGTNNPDLGMELGRSWGGMENDDNSGTLKYVRLEYAGANTFVNTLNLFGVGSTTILEYIQIYKAGDEGFKLNGGRANLRYIVSTDLAEDDLEAEAGWVGNVQFYLIEQNRDTNGETAMAIKNGSGGTPSTRPTFSNVTYIGPGIAFAPDPFDYDNEGLDVQNDANGRFFNMLMTENPDDAVRVRDSPDDITGIDGDLVVAHSIFWNNNDNWQDDGDLFNTPAYNNSNDDPGIGVGLDSFVGVVTTGALDPTTLDPWFESATFIGAVPADNDWTADGSWCKNRDGSIR